MGQHMHNFRGVSSHPLLFNGTVIFTDCFDAHYFFSYFSLHSLTLILVDYKHV